MLLGIDLGTGSAKALLLDPDDGSVAGEGSAAYQVRTPQPGWAESHPEDWWEAVVGAVRSAVGDLRDEVVAVGLSGQMHAVVPTGADGDPLRPAILAVDTRSAGHLGCYRALEEGQQSRLANPPATGMAGPTLLWLRDEETEIYRAARWTLQPKDWLRLRLTGQVAAEPSDASATLLYDLVADDWAYDVADALGLRTDSLAPLVASAAVAGELTSEAARRLGLRTGLPVAAGAGDTAAAMLGTGLLDEGLIQLTVGTSAQVLTPKTRPDPDPRERTHLFRAAAPGLFYALGAVQNAGLALEWVRKILGATWDDVYREAFEVPPGAGGVTFLPYLSGERTPHFDPHARGAWAGLGLGHRRGHLLRAALEGVAFGLREALEALEAVSDAGEPAPELRLAGGGSAREPWRRLLADVLGRPLRLLPDGVASVASARGAALLAGVASGVYRDTRDTIRTATGPVRAIHPGPAAEYAAAYGRYREVYPRLQG